MPAFFLSASRRFYFGVFKFLFERQNCLHRADPQ